MVTKKKPSKKPSRSISPRKVNSTGRGPTWTFPKCTLEDAIRVAKAIEDKNAGKPMHSKDIARAVGFNQPDWRFLDLLRAANLYGLTLGSGASSLISLAPIGNDIVAPSASTQRQAALLGAFRNVDDFKRVESHYQGKRIPEDEFFINTLVRDFGVPRDRADKFTEVFINNLKFLRAFSSDESTDSIHVDSQDRSESSPILSAKSKPVIQNARPREFLETCFVMMPFGSWFDKYYQDIYAPAIRDAGFEPVRADELFSTGSVVEQIWEQIEKSAVLLADLTDKNANVFYELGLAHAARKPVVFTSRRVDDIPFDLRHLRVIVYETQEPNWSVKLQTSITDYLKNAAKDPDKSIPNPFRSEGSKKN
jgi:hypothetical protein